MVEVKSRRTTPVQLPLGLADGEIPNGCIALD